MNAACQKARDFIYRNARPLDLARWQYHFEDGSKEAVLRALSFYQNEDGGFGHALEADAWNPHSAPIQTWVATEILREIEFTDPAHPIVKGILRYLESGKDFNGSFWYKVVESNNAYPHAPWWYTDADTTDHNDYNATACLAGFILRFAEADSAIFQTAHRVAREAFAQLSAGRRENGLHTLTCYCRLWEYLERARLYDIINLPTLKELLRKQVHDCISQDAAEWETSYVCKPSQFLNSPNSPFYADNQAMADYECGFIVKTQLADGSWNIPWDWGNASEEWAVSKNWWKSDRILLNLLYLKGFGKL